jgi:hypothetical protein
VPFSEVEETRAHVSSAATIDHVELDALRKKEAICPQGVRSFAWETWAAAAGWRRRERRRRSGEGDVSGGDGRVKEMWPAAAAVGFGARVSREVGASGTMGRANCLLFLSGHLNRYFTLIGGREV